MRASLFCYMLTQLPMQQTDLVITQALASSRNLVRFLEDVRLATEGDEGFAAAPQLLRSLADCLASLAASSKRVGTVRGDGVLDALRCVSAACDTIASCTDRTSIWPLIQAWVGRIVRDATRFTAQGPSWRGRPHPRRPA